MTVSIHKYNTEHSAISSMEYRGCEIQYLTLGGCIFWRICLRICGSPHLVSDVGFPSENLWVWIDKNSRNRNFGHRRYSQISSLWKNSVWAPRTVSMNLDKFFSKKNYHDGAGMSSAFKGIPAIQFPKDPGSPKTQLQMIQNCWKPLEITFSDCVNMVYKKIRPKTSSLLQNYSVHLDHNACYFHYFSHILILKK